MKISYNWLKDYVSFNLEPETVASILTSIGLEVEGIESVEQIPGGLEGVIVAEVMECEKHPDADKLRITKLNIGTEELLQVVCGAPNVAAGQKVLLATVGTKLQGDGGEEFKIKRSKIRGVESLGMICAEDELGIGTSHDGIMVLPVETRVGMAAKEYLNLSTETIFEIGLTPNRVDAASHIGVARDLSAYLKLNNLGGDLLYPTVDSFKEGEGEAIPVEVECAEAAPKYFGLTLDNITVAPSPEWLKEKLLSVGVRPINNVVDITNYVLQEVGQPLHAFDASKIEGDKVTVRLSTPGCKFKTLDDIERELSADDLVICNQSAPMCLAGVFGGAESGITEATTKIFLESAYFHPVYIRKTSKRHTLKTDASFRYERGADVNIVEYALKRAALLLQEIAGAKVVGLIQKSYPVEIKRKEVEINFERMEKFIGKKIGADTIVNILTFMDFEFISKDDCGAVVSVPTYRVDVYRECDIVEDVLRIYGYNNIELPVNVRSSINATAKPDPERVRALVSDFLASNGFVETMNNSLTKAEYYENLTSYPKDNCVMLLNPLSQDLNGMRQTLLLNGLEVIAYNSNRQLSDLKLFEIGNVYAIKAGGDRANLESYQEEQRLSIFITGNGSQGWRNSTVGGNYFALKGYLELLLKRVGIDINNLEYGMAPADLFSEGLEYSINGSKLAVMGCVSKARLKQFGIKQQVYAIEISWPLFFKLIKRNKVKYKELPKFPEVKRDLALLLDESISFADIRATAFKVERKMLKQVTLFDVYRGDKIAEGKKQYAINFVLQDSDKTLTDKFVEDVMAKLLKEFSAKYGAALR